ncbi:peroxiredoxin family protein [Acidobacteria bacterium AH-259-A15]|nr:peroxiredoxin family protein [Acidobacteria bacterium AH-259-A15]
MKRKYFAIAGSLLLGWVGTVVGQPAAENDTSARERVVGQFLEKAPKIGEVLPDVEAFDADGKPFRLGSLKGHYTVLVLGCLT